MGDTAFAARHGREDKVYRPINRLALRNGNESAVANESSVQCGKCMVIKIGVPSQIRLDSVGMYCERVGQTGNDGSALIVGRSRQFGAKEAIYKYEPNTIRQRIR